eukprot:3408055-Alexandrium_andersonii.AAC.1
MARAGPILPRHSLDRPLYGTFRKNHLVCLLQLVKAGSAKFAGSEEVIAAVRGPGAEELWGVLDHGVEMD